MRRPRRPLQRLQALANAAFVNNTFTRCSFFDATFTGYRLVGSMFDGCTFGLLEVDGEDWSFTGLPGADLQRSVVQGCGCARRT